MTAPGPAGRAGVAVHWTVLCKQLSSTSVGTVTASCNCIVSAFAFFCQASARCIYSAKYNVLIRIVIVNYLRHDQTKVLDLDLHDIAADERRSIATTEFPSIQMLNSEDVASEDLPKIHSFIHSFIHSVIHFSHSVIHFIHSVILPDVTGHLNNIIKFTFWLRYIYCLVCF